MSQSSTIYRFTLIVVAPLLIALASGRSWWARGTTTANSAIELPSQETPAASLKSSGYDLSGLCMVRPFARGKIPVVFIHGLCSVPRSWDRMIEGLEADPSTADRYQFWTFSYATADPIPYSASLLRRDVQKVRQRFDPDKSDPAFDRMVLVGHSMGGILAKMMVQDSEDRLWDLISARPVDNLQGDPEDRDMVRRTMFFTPVKEVHRVLFIATPHHGSVVPQVLVQHIGARLVRTPGQIGEAFDRLLARNDPEYFRRRIRRGSPSSIDEIAWSATVLSELQGLRVSPRVVQHSIIAVCGDQPSLNASDGLVPYTHAHIDGAASEVIVPSGHYCQGRSEVILEVRRILASQVDH